MVVVVVGEAMNASELQEVRGALGGYIEEMWDCNENEKDDERMTENERAYSVALNEGEAEEGKQGQGDEVLRKGHEKRIEDDRKVRYHILL
jgi:hypothetical protein